MVEGFTDSYRIKNQKLMPVHYIVIMLFLIIESDVNYRCCILILKGTKLKLNLPVYFWSTEMLTFYIFLWINDLLHVFFQFIVQIILS